MAAVAVTQLRAQALGCMRRRQLHAAGRRTPWGCAWIDLHAAAVRARLHINPLLPPRRLAQHFVNNLWAIASTTPFYSVKIIGRENLPPAGSPAVYVANHQSFMVRGVGGAPGCVDASCRSHGTAHSRQRCHLQWMLCALKRSTTLADAV